MKMVEDYKSIIILGVIIIFSVGFGLGKTFYDVDKDVNINKFNSMIDDLMIDNRTQPLQNPILYTMTRFVHPDMTLRDVHSLYISTAPFSYGVAYEVIREVCN